MQALLIGNDVHVLVEGLREHATGAAIDDAQLAATVYELNGAPVAGAQDLALAHVADSGGNYRGTVPAAVSFVEGRRYRVVVQAANYGFRQTLLVEARVRRATE